MGILPKIMSHVLEICITDHKRGNAKLASSKIYKIEKICHTRRFKQITQLVYYFRFM